MKEIDLQGFTGSVSPKYISVPQPMKILHSKAELNQELVGISNYNIVENLNDFVDYINKYDLPARNGYADVTATNTWIGTGEKFVPDYFTNRDVIIWKQDDDGNLVPTDNCYVRLYIIHAINNSYLLFTSSGVFSVGLGRWKLSAAWKPQFNRTMTYVGSKALPQGRLYEERMERFLKRRQQTVLYTRLFYLMFSSNSPHFMKPEDAVDAVFPSIKSKDRKKVLSTKAFQTTFIREVSKLMPELKDEFKEYFTGKKMPKMAERIFEAAFTDKNATTGDRIKAFDVIYNIMESDDRVPAYNPRIIGDKDSNKVTQGRKEKVIGDGLNISEYDDADVKTTIVTEKKDKENPKEEEELLKRLRKETGSLDVVNEGSDLR